MNSATASAVSATRTGTLPAILALAVGLLIVYGAGFAHPAAIHNAAHDTRHAFGLPCH